MLKRDKDKLSEFNTLAEEREYWEARGPIAEGYKGRITKPKTGQNRNSFLSVRLTGEELTQLRDVAARLGMGPSTFARAIIKQAIEQDYPVAYISGKRQASPRKTQPQYIHESKRRTKKDK